MAYFTVNLKLGQAQWRSSYFLKEFMHLQVILQEAIEFSNIKEVIDG